MPANANVLKDDESVIFDKSKKQPQFVRFGKCTKCMIRNAAHVILLLCVRRSAPGGVEAPPARALGAGRP